MKITFVIGFAAAIGLTCIIQPTNIMLFENSDGSDVLSILSLSILFSSLSITTASILQGLGQTLKPAIFVVFGGCLKLVLNYILMPYFGAKGAAIATLVALIVISVLNSMLLMRAVSESLIDKRNMLGIVISGFSMGFVLIMFMRVLQMSGLVMDTSHRGVATFEALLGVAIGGLAYMFLILKLRVFTKAEIGTVMKKRKKKVH